MKIALLGAESTGKTTLSLEMARQLRDRGHRVAVVGEVLREWCVREGRTPRPEEQLPIAQEQERRVDEAAAGADIVIADTTALMVAVYSAMLFKDGALYQFALERHRAYDLTLLTGLDIEWVADGVRDGPDTRHSIDAQVREVLAQAGIGWRVIYGQGQQRAFNALQEVASLAPWAWSAPPPAGAAQDAERWARLASTCEKCGDAVCEHRLFTRLTAPPT